MCIHDPFRESIAGIASHRGQILQINCCDWCARPKAVGFACGCDTSVALGKLRTQVIEFTPAQLCPSQTQGRARNRFRIFDWKRKRCARPAHCPTSALIPSCANTQATVLQLPRMPGGHVPALMQARPATCGSRSRDHYVAFFGKMYRPPPDDGLLGSL